MPPAAGSRHPSMSAEEQRKTKAEDTPDAAMSDAEASSVASDDEDASQQKGDSAEASAGGASAPVQKRRRVTRACDECRRKKIKCDGKQPCTHCQVYSYDCSYDKPSNRRRNPAPQYIEALENRLQRAEELLRNFMPDVDLTDPNLEPSVQQEFRLREQARKKAHKKDPAPNASSTKRTDERLSSMISGVGQLELDDQGDYDFHGLSSGTVFFRRMKEHFRSLLGRDYHVPVLPQPPRSSRVLNLDSPRNPLSGSSNSKRPSSELYDLPSKVEARRLCSYSLKNATCLLRIVHIPTFYTMLDKLYEKPNGTHGPEDSRNLALLYSVMALGCMYNVNDDKNSKKAPYEIATEQGLKYYTSARFLLQDITDCRDLTSLQALLFMILFIQSTSNISTCYGFVGIALRSALRMGLHRNLPHAQGNPIELESRRRVFSVCRQMDIYVSALLGFPMLLNDEDIDQPLPTPVDDEYVTKNGVMSTPAGTPSFFEAFNAHARLMDILNRIIKHIYPLKGIEQTAAEGSQTNPSYMISYAKVKEMENALQEWNESLPIAWRPDSDGPEDVVRVRNLLRFAYAHVQMVLYRPFLHAVSQRLADGKTVDDRSYACGAAGINVARNVIHIGIEMRKQVSLVGPYWFTLFTEFFAIISLVFYVLENDKKPGTTDIMADAAAGRNMIKKLARRSLAAERISKALEVLFEQLPAHMKKVGASEVPSRKRSAGSKSSTTSLKIRTASNTAFCTSPGPLDPKGTVEPNPMDITFDQGFNIEDFSPNIPTVSPLQLLASPPSSMHPSFSDPQHLQLEAGEGLNQLHQIDAVMFPSEDPLAYPNQPGMDAGHLRGADQGQFFMSNPGFYDDIEGQLMGPLPPYRIPTHGNASLGFASPLYADPMMSMPMQQSHTARMAHQNHPYAHLQAPQQEQRRRMFNQFANAQFPGMFPHYN